MSGKATPGRPMVGAQLSGHGKIGEPLEVSSTPLGALFLCCLSCDPLRMPSRMPTILAPKSDFGQVLRHRNQIAPHNGCKSDIGLQKPLLQRFRRPGFAPQLSGLRLPRPTAGHGPMRSRSGSAGPCYESLVKKAIVAARFEALGG